MWGTVGLVVGVPTLWTVFGSLPWLVPLSAAVVVLLAATLEGAYRVWEEAKREFDEALRERDEQFNAYLSHSAAMRRQYGSNITPLASEETTGKLAWLGERLERGSELKRRMDAAHLGEAEALVEEIDAWETATVEGMRVEVPEFVPEYLSPVAGENDSFRHRAHAYDRYLEIKLRKLEEIRREIRARAA